MEKSTIKFAFDKSQNPCELSCVIEIDKLNIVLPPVEGKPSKPANCFSHTGGVLFVIGHTRQLGNPLRNGRHACSWLETAHQGLPLNPPSARTHQKELNPASPLRRTSVV